MQHTFMYYIIFDLVSPTRSRVTFHILTTFSEKKLVKRFLKWSILNLPLKGSSYVLCIGVYEYIYIYIYLIQRYNILIIIILLTLPMWSYLYLFSCFFFFFPYMLCAVGGGVNGWSPQLWDSAGHRWPYPDRLKVKMY